MYPVIFNAGGGTRTHTPLRATDFESASSAIPTRRLNHDSSIITEKTKSVYNLSNEIFYSIIKGGLKRRIGGHYGLRTG